MLAQSVYLKVTRLSLRSASNLSKRRVDELSSGIGELRQLLSCVVCCQLLVDPYSPKGKRCQHNVCRLCLRGKKRLFPRCSQCEDCSDFKTYEENRMMGTQLLCYKTLCVHLLHSALFGQLSGLRPQVGRELVSRIRLPPLSTQDFIREGSNISDTGDTFLPQPDLPFLKDLPTSLPAETPPTTAATTPELPYDRHLNISDIEAEAAATAEQGHFSPLPLLPTGSRMGLLAHGGQIVIATESSESGFMDHAWTDQVDLSGAVSVSSFPGNSTNFAVSYVMPTAASTPFNPQDLQIGQVVQMANSAELAVLAAVEETDETSAQLTELPAEEPEEALPTIEEVEETSITSETLAEEHKEVNTHVEMHTSQPPNLEEVQEPQEEQVTQKRKLGDMQAEWQEEEQQAQDKNLEELQAAAEEEAQDVEWQPSCEVQQEDNSTESQPKRRKTRSKKSSTAAKIEPAPAEVKAKLQSGKGAFRKIRGKEAEEKVKPPKSKCRCGISGAANTLTTCRNSRCPCYKNFNSCADCHCVGCKNPHKEDYVESDHDDDDFEEVLKEAPEPEPVEQAAEEPKQEETSVDMVPATNGAIQFVLLSDMMTAPYPVVLMENETGGVQGFNIFQDNKPVDPATAGYIYVQVHNNNSKISLPKFAYVMPPPALPEPPAPSLSPPPPPPAPSLSPPPPPPAPEREVIEPPAKKFRTSRTRRGRANFSALDTVDELVSGGSRSNSAAGDRLSATDNAHLLFEEIMSGSDDL
ncbi:E3 ubiquitin-protein ligase msl-2 [Drosophila biarmipes]|uniref:E3 ubiquitin-protein ligase msl-2 n=1 Tax=Drosophila biarmipes TaxID=125945 RepID=UPI0007E72AC5|nr:E3 ubiquitin-protein ligase msl-2 [Drosophila biarmipes]